MEYLRVSISDLKPFDNHPFKPYSPDKMAMLTESIETQGLINAILIRPIEHPHYKYEIISGHNRVQARKNAGHKTILAEVRNLSDEEATVLMVDSNLHQRDQILPSEKAFAYKVKLDALKRQGQRTDLSSTQNACKLETADMIGHQNFESGDTVRRYIRLTYLSKRLLEKVDSRQLPFMSAVNISYLSKREQNVLYDVMETEELFNIPVKTASKIKSLSETGQFNEDNVRLVLIECAKNRETTNRLSISASKINKYFPKTATPREKETTILRALEMYYKSQSKNKNPVHQQSDKGIERQGLEN